MRRTLIIKSIVLIQLLFVLGLKSENVPLSTCMSAQVEQGDILEGGSCEYGAWNSKTGASKMTCTLNEYFYQQGSKCGDCFEVTGSNGKSVTVRAVNFCSKGTCPSDSPFFMLTPEAFSKISDASNPVIHDAGFRKVSCDSTGSLKGQFSNDSNSFYLKLLVFNNEVGISQVSIQGQNMSKPEPMIRQNSAKFVWANGGSQIVFPINITVVSQYGSSVMYTMNTLKKLDIFSFSSNFKVPENLVPGSPKQCLLSQTPSVIYTDSLAEGWDYYSSKDYRFLNETDESNPASGKAAFCVTLVGAKSSLTISRAGNFQLEYFSGIKFNIRSERDWNGFRFYFHQESWWTPVNKTINGQWTQLSMNFTDIKHSSIEHSISFGNEDDENVRFCIDNVSFILAPKNSVEGSKEPTTTPSSTTTVTTIGSESSQESSSTSSTTTHHSSATITSVSSTLFIILLLISILLF
ncbi:expansin-like protein [Tieghemostelium lacteum]|uniref:Expansin-like protein n=1 Tax=Tieghemostelium lacteum TaxID=361077 RepID=A0A152A2E8_TIELA|nr:expansin-like protein [Tieghemostelium lacteum]|eukprot:KYR00423.1 expansin-like protein [Tieghemostelium lacteum]